MKISKMIILFMRNDQFIRPEPGWVRGTGSCRSHSRLQGMPNLTARNGKRFWSGYWFGQGDRFVSPAFTTSAKA